MKNGRPPIVEFDKELIIKLLSEKNSYDKISEITGIKKSNLINYIHRHSLKYEFKLINDFIIKNNDIYIDVQGETYIIDLKFIDIIKNNRFWINQKCVKTTLHYAAAHIKQKRNFLHRMIYESVNGKIEEGYFIDHKDGDVHNNRISNLHSVTQKYNANNTKLNDTNTTGYKGVSPQNGRYKVQAMIGGKKKHIGMTDNPIECALWYDKAKYEDGCSLRNLNFPGLVFYL